MTRIAWTEKQLAQAAKNPEVVVEEQPTIAKPAKVVRKSAQSARSLPQEPKPSPPAVTECEGLFGTRLHKWHWRKDWGLWSTQCGIAVRRQPGEGDGVRCVRCYPEGG